MTITCPKCKARLDFPDEELRPGETRVKCSECGTTLVYKGKSRRAPQDRPAEPKPSPSSIPAGVPEAPPSLEAQPPLNSQVGPEEIRLPQSLGTAEIKERPKKTEAVSETIRQRPSPVAEEGKAGPRKAVFAGAAAGILIAVLLAVFFFFSSREDVKHEQAPPPTATKGVTPPPSTEAKDEAAQGGTQGAATPAQGSDSAQQPVSVDSEADAIEMVKRSDALLKNTPVEAIVKKWTEEKAAKYKVVGWQARKMDEQRYLVSYTALDGNAPKGFYFDLDARSGVVQDLARNPDLQKKYNIQYSQ